MSDCNCKNGKSMEEMLNDDKPATLSIGSQLIKYSLKILGFLLMVALLPIINLVIIWFIFNLLVLNKNIDIKPALVFLGKKFQEKDTDEDNDDVDFDKLTEDDVVLLDVNEITNE